MNRPAIAPRLARRAREHRVTFTLRACVAAMAAAGLVSGAPLHAQGLPVWRQGQVNPIGSNIAKSGTASIASQTDRAMTVNQSTDRAIVNWYTFNIGADKSVQFVQPGTTSAILNRVGRGVDASRIAGTLTANGQVYLINPNGIVFENGSQTNVGGLVASTLDIKDDVFLDGILDTQSLQNAQFVFDGTTAEDVMAAAVSVQRGAQIASARGGRIFLFGTSVANEGTLTSPEGQVALAAGGKVYITQPTDTLLRNVLVEVDPVRLDDGAGGTLTIDGSVRNAAGGVIETARGNTTMVAYAVNQEGRISATNAVDLDGSIVLTARDTAANGVVNEGIVSRKGERAGVLTIGAGSVTEVRPDTDAAGAYSTKETTETPRAARIDLYGRDIAIGADAALVAHAGEIGIVARKAEGSLANDPSIPDPTIVIAAGATLDVSGLQNVTRAMSANELEVELRGFELADSPMQREGVLRTRGQEKFYFDRRALDADGKTPIANLSGYAGQVGVRIDEASTRGGKVSIDSGNGSVKIERGAVVDVSGGRTTFERGVTRRTFVRDESGHEYDINTAPADRKYVSYRVVKVEEAGYVRGADAGTFAVTSGSGEVQLGATLRGSAVVGLHQRLPGGIGDSARPLGGTFELNTSRDVLIGNASTLAGAQDASVGIDTGNLNAGGFAALAVTTNRAGDITLAQGSTLALSEGGTVALDGKRVDLYGNISAAGGSVFATASAATLAPGDYGVTLHAGASIDVAGGWTNDDLAGTQSGVPTAVVQNGGSVSLKSTGGDVSIEHGARIDVSGGARLAGGKLAAGNAGSISLSAGARDSSTNDLVPGTVTVAGELRGEVFADSALKASAKGGTLSVTASDLRVAADAVGITSADGVTTIGSDVFAQGGFQNFSLAGIERVRVEDDTVIAPAPNQRLLARGYQFQHTGADARAFSQAIRVADDQRKASKVTLKAGLFSSDTGKSPGSLTIGRGAAVRVNPGGSIEVSSSRQLTLDGSLVAQGGAVSLMTGQYPQEGLPSGDLFNADRSLRIGAGANIDVSGVSVFDPRPAAGRITGKVLDGGSIDVSAGEGWLIVEQGATLNARGAAAELDVGQTGQVQQRANVASNGGSMTFTSRYGMWLDGSFDAHGGGASASNGALRIEQKAGIHAKPIDEQSVATFLDVPATAVVTGARTDHAGAAPSIETDLGIARISTQAIAEGGFDNVAIVAGSGDAVAAAHAIRFEGDSSLSVRGTLQLDAPNLVSTGGTQTLRAGTVEIGDLAGTRGRTVANVTTPADTVAPSQLNASLAAPTAGTGRLDVQADAIDIVGDVHSQGYGSVNLAADGDIRLRGAVGTQDSGQRSDNKPVPEPLYAGSLVTGADLTLKARTVYPVTGAQFEIAVDAAENPNGTVRFERNGTQGGVAQSALGALAVSAPNIVQAGDLQAPFGSISLVAGETLTLAEGSRTSVSADGDTLMYGQTRLTGREWFYDYSAPGTTGGTNDRLVLDELGTSQVTLSGKSVDLHAGASVDLSGGGDLVAAEFISGAGGSSDIFSDPQVYAIVPASASARAAYDYQVSSSSTLRAGEQIVLYDSVGGLAAGTYTLMPARYALTDPNAVLVWARSDSTSFKSTDFSASQTRQLTDGSYLVAGRRIIDGLGGETLQVDSRTLAFQVATVDWAKQRSEILETKASDYFADSGSRTLDAGQLTIRARESLALGASLTAAAQEDGRRALVDISADRLLVVADAAEHEAGTVTVSAADLAQFNAGSLLLGGERHVLADGTQSITTTASQVTIGTSVQISGAETILAATDTVRVGEGARVTAAGDSDVERRAIATAGNGALLRVGVGDLPEFSRTGVTIDAATMGTLDIAAGASIGGQSIILDATRTTTNAGTLALVDGGGLALGAPRITAGAASGPVDGIVITPELMASTANAGELRFKSYTSVDLVGAASIGGTATKKLTIETGSIRGLDNAGQHATLQAQTVRIANPDGTAASTATVAEGSGLDIVADTIEFGRGNAAIVGFAATTLTAAKEARATGDGKLTVAGQLTVQAGQVTATAGKHYTIAGTGDVDIARAAAVSRTATAADGSIAIEAAKRLDVSGTIVARSGSIALSGADGVTLHDGALVDASGYSAMFADKTVAAQAGAISIVSANGNVALESGSSVTVAGRDGGDAGSVKITAQQGSISLGGTLNGAAARTEGQTADPRQGELTLDAYTLPAFEAVAAANAAGFTETIDLRQRNGDLHIASDVKAANFTAAADNGGIEVSATIDASEQAGGEQRGGRVLLYAQGDASATGAADANGLGGRVILTGTAKILANATTTSEDGVGDTGRAGSVLLSATGAGADKIVIRDGAFIDVSVPDDSAQQGGTITLRAPRTSDGAGVQIAAIPNADARFRTGAGGQVIVEAVKTYQGSIVKQAANSGAGATPDVPGTIFLTGATNSIDADNKVLAANVAAIDAALFGTTTVAHSIRPGAEIVSTGDITIAASQYAVSASPKISTMDSLKFESLRYQGNADAASRVSGVLTLRAAGNVNVDNPISDGYLRQTGALSTRANLPALSSDTLMTSGVSWSYRITAGADASAANLLATNAARTGDVRLADGAFIRTGAGSIDVAAAGSVLFGKAKLVAGVTTGATELRTSAIYTGGVADNALSLNEFPYAVTQVLDSWRRNYFGRHGGDVRITAGGSIAPEAGKEAEVYYGDWLFRQGDFSEGLPTVAQRYLAWWGNPAGLDQAVGTFGGGDVVVRAGQDVSGVTLASVSNARQGIKTKDDAGLPLATPELGTYIEQGGGSVDVRAGGSVLGTTMVTTAGDIAVTAATLGNEPVFAVGGGSVSVYTLGDAEVQTVLNATLGEQSAKNLANNGSDRTSYFSTYLPDSAFTVTSLAGDVVLSNAPYTVASGNATGPQLSTLYPGTVQVAALDGSIDVKSGMTLYPSAQGQLDFLAADSVMLAGAIVQSDVDPTLLPTRLSPIRDFVNDAALRAVYEGEIFGAAAHVNAEHALHDTPDAQDLEPSRIVARDGSITATLGGYVGLAESATVEAGEDITYLQLIAQNVRSTDVTRVSAGGSIRYPTIGDGIRGNSSTVGGRTVTDPTNAGIRIGGPGDVVVMAGEDINLGDSAGIVTRGNLDNPYLPEGGANVLALAGVQKLDTAQFASYVNAPEQALVRSTIKYEELLAAYLAELGVAGGDDALATLTPAQRNNFYFAVFGAIARDFGAKAAETGRKGLYFVMYEAVAKLFPESVNGQRYAQLVAETGMKLTGNGSDLRVEGNVATFFEGLKQDTATDRGNIDLFFSQIATDQNGSITLFAPDGGINVGLENDPVRLSEVKTPSELGIIAKKKGALRMYSAGSVAVNQSRVFTLGGGELVLLSFLRDVDAGRGQKTANATPPADVIVRDDFLRKDLGNAISGSGIGALRGSDDVADADVTLLAPIGAVDAGDAGVRSTGRTVVAAETVRNALNISAGGGLTGAIATPPSAPTASIAPPSAGADAARAGEAAAAGHGQQGGNAGNSVFTAEIVGTGETDCTANASSEECRLRAERESEEEKKKNKPAP